MECPMGVMDPCPDALSGVPAHLFLTLVNALMASKCSISSKTNYPHDYGPSISDQDEFDFIVVGSGTAGSVVANKLSENPQWRVLVLEAGGYPLPTSEIPSLLFSLQGTENDWQYVTEPSDKACLGFKERRCKWPRGKCLGGSSSINAMLYVRGNSKDYDRWAQLGNEGWDFGSVEKFFKLSENLQDGQLENSTRYGRQGYQSLSVYDSGHPVKEAIKATARELGYPTLLEEGDFGYFEVVQTIEKGARANAAKSFLGKVKDRQNLVVALNSFAENLVVDSSKTVQGVIAKIGGKRVTLKAKREVILSAGAVNTPQILMLSGIGPKQHLDDLGIQVIQDLKVGENVQDHLFFMGLYMKIASSGRSNDNILDHLYRYFAHKEGPMAQIDLTNLVALVNTRKDSQRPNLQFHHVFHPQNDNYLLPELMRVIAVEDEIAQAYFTANQQSDTLTIYPTPLHPKSRGKILLKSTNPRDKPLIYANYLDHPDDMQTLLEAVRYVEKMAETAPLRAYNPEIVDLKIRDCEGLEYRSDEFWECVIKHMAGTVYHPVGSCKMGPKSDPGAVVDPRLRVHGVANLRVIDASIMPEIPGANTNAATLMVGQKGAKMVMEDWGYHHDEL